MKRILLSVIVLFAVALCVMGDTLKGRIIDAETKDPIEGAYVYIKQKHESMTVGSTTSSDSLGCFSGHAYMLRTTVEISAIGYYDKRVNVACSEDKALNHLGDIEMKPNTKILRELKVRAKMKRFTLRGDTIVFNPEAFSLEEGERLDALLKKLPGMQLNGDGSLSWNGRPVRLRMNGNNTLSDNLIGQLPVEAVQEIKGYDKQSEFAERTGNDDGKSEQVLDIVIKKGWLDKWYGEVSADITTKAKYAGNLRTNRLSDSDPLMVYARVGDDDMMYKPYGFSGRFGMGGSRIRQQMGAAGYQHSWNPAFEGWKNRSRWDVTGFFNHYDDRSKTETRKETFLDGAESNMSQSVVSEYEHAIETPLNFSSFLNLNPNTTLSIRADAKYNRSIKDSETNSTSWLNDEAETKVNDTRYLATSRKEGAAAKLLITGKHFFAKNIVGIGANLKYDDYNRSSLSNNTYNYYTGDGTVADELRTTDGKTRNLAAGIFADVSMWLSKQFMIEASYSFDYNNDKEKSAAMLNDAIDRNNTFQSRLSAIGNLLSIDGTWKVGKFMVMPSIELETKHEKMDYCRGALDTAAVRNTVLFTPILSFQWKKSNANSLRGSIKLLNTQPEILSSLDYVDDSNPLYVIEGNSGLKCSKKLKGELTYVVMLPKNEQMLTLGVDAAKDFDPIGNVLYYNSTSGGYRSRSENMKGGVSLGGTIDYSLTVKNVDISNRIKIKNTSTYGLMTIVDGIDERTLTSQKVTSFAYEPSATYQIGNFKLDVDGSFTLKNNRYNEGDVSKFNIYQYSLNADAGYKVGIFEFKLCPEFYGYKGYNTPRFNRDFLVLNAKAIARLMNKKLTLTVAANDIFNSQTFQDASETVDGRSEEFTDYLHNYVQFSVSYKFDAK